MSSTRVWRVPLGTVAVLVVCVVSAFGIQLPIQVFRTANGLPRNTAACLVSGRTGLIWLCTTEGLVSFDGYGFRVLGPDNGLPSRAILDLVPARAGGYWVVTDRGVCRLRGEASVNNRCQLIPIERPEGNFISRSVLETDRGETWVATTGGLWFLSADGSKLKRAAFRLQRKSSPFDQELRFLAEFKDGYILVGSDEGVYLWRPGSLPRDLTNSSAVVGALSFSRQSGDNIWVGMSNGLSRVVSDPIQRTARFEHFNLPGIQYVTGLSTRRDGSLWISSRAGVSRIEVSPQGSAREAVRITDKEGLPSSDLTQLMEDHQGDLWGATVGAGVYRIGSSRIIRYSADDGIGPYRIASIFEDLNHELCVRSGYLGKIHFQVLRNGRFEPVSIPFPPAIHYFGWGWNQWGLQAHDGDWFIPTGDGLVRFPKTARAEDLARTRASEVLDSGSPIHAAALYRLFEDLAGDFWIAAFNPERLIRWERKKGRVTTWRDENGYPRNDIVTVIRQSKDGVYWIGTSMGAVLRYRGDRFETFALPATPGPMDIRDLLIDRKGGVWVATLRSGLLRCDHPDQDKPRFRLYTTREGLMSDSLRSLTEDDRGFIYAGTVRGVDRIDPRTGGEGRQRILHLTAADGLPDAEQSVAFRDSRGHLWFGTLAGLAELTPSAAERSAPAEALITRVRVRGEDAPVPIDGASNLSLNLASNRNQLEIEFAGIDLRSAGTLRYQYRLGGIDTQWSELQEQRTVNYARVPPGRFRFEVRAVNAESQISLRPAGIDIVVEADLWQRPWFIALMLVAASGLGWTAYNYRVRQLLEIERIRTRIATDLHDDIGASLSQISILSEVAKRGGAPQMLTDIANISRAIVQEMSDIVWAVSPKHDRMEALIHRMRRFAADTLGAADIEFDFQAIRIPPDFETPLEIRRPLYLVFKEAVTNVARHSKARCATVRLEVHGPSLRLEVHDDGCGFDQMAPHDGEGRSNILRRVRDIGGTVAWSTAPGTGVHFLAIVPLRNTRAR